MGYQSPFSFGQESFIHSTAKILVLVALFVNCCEDKGIQMCILQYVLTFSQESCEKGQTSPKVGLFASLITADHNW